MTFWEKVKNEYPAYVGPRYANGVYGCPYDFGLEDRKVIVFFVIRLMAAKARRNGYANARANQKSQTQPLSC